MRHILLSALLAVVAAPASAANVAVSISAGEPGFYGQINIGDYPKPNLIYAQPVIVEQVASPVPIEPIYLHVPPGYEKHWKRHCHKYHACGRPVFFVQDRWYNDVYVVHHRERMERGIERRVDRRVDRRIKRRDERREANHR